MVHSKKELEADGTRAEGTETDPVIEEQQVLKQDKTEKVAYIVQQMGKIINEQKKVREGKDHIKKIENEEARSVLVQDCCAIKIRSDTSGKSAEDGIRQDFFN